MPRSDAIQFCFLAAALAFGQPAAAQTGPRPIARLSLPALVGRVPLQPVPGTADSIEWWTPDAVPARAAGRQIDYSGRARAGVIGGLVGAGITLGLWKYITLQCDGPCAAKKSGVPVGIVGFMVGGIVGLNLYDAAERRVRVALVPTGEAASFAIHCRIAVGGDH